MKNNFIENEITKFTFNQIFYNSRVKKEFDKINSVESLITAMNYANKIYDLDIINMINELSKYGCVYTHGYFSITLDDEDINENVIYNISCIFYNAILKSFVLNIATYMTQLDYLDKHKETLSWHPYIEALCRFSSTWGDILTILPQYEYTFINIDFINNEDLKFINTDKFNEHMMSKYKRNQQTVSAKLGFVYNYVRLLGVINLIKNYYINDSTIPQDLKDIIRDIAKNIYLTMYKYDYRDKFYNCDKPEEFISVGEELVELLKNIADTEPVLWIWY